jgi:hypothetical protein
MPTLWDRSKLTIATLQSQPDDQMTAGRSSDRGVMHNNGELLDRWNGSIAVASQAIVA